MALPGLPGDQDLAARISLAAGGVRQYYGGRNNILYATPSVLPGRLMVYFLTDHGLERYIYRSSDFVGNFNEFVEAEEVVQ